MALFTFHIYRDDGSPLSLEARDFASPDQATEHAERVFADHASAQLIVLCLGEVEIATVRRAARA